MAIQDEDSGKRRKWIFAAVIGGVLLLIYRPVSCSQQELEPVPSDHPRGISEVAWGERLFADFGCAGCHSIAGARGIGGPLNGIMGQTRRFTGGGEAVVDEAYLRESVREPRLHIVEGYPPSMPSYEMSDPQIEALVAYLARLR